MERISSFQIDHRFLDIGMYISRIDGDIITYDVRMVKPNGGKYLSSASMHTIEHLFATYARNSQYGERVIYVGPMGCRTGFYLLTRELGGQAVIDLVRDSLEFISEFDGEIPGATEPECGNFREHDLENARKDVVPVLTKLRNYTEDMLNYPVKCVQK